MSDNEQRIRRSWERDATAWTHAVRAGTIASRATTDRAMLDAILDCRPHSVLDLGCGEGTLVRRLASHGLKAQGIDASAALIKHARALGGTYHHLGYEQLDASWAQVCPAGDIDLACCHFSLLGEHSTPAAIAALGHHLTDHARMLIQTLHPLSPALSPPYLSGWRAGTWAGIEGDFGAPAPWYFRTLADWSTLLGRHGFMIDTLQEPKATPEGTPLSLLIIARKGLVTPPAS